MKIALLLVSWMCLAPLSVLATAPTLPQLSVTTTDPSLLGTYRRTIDCTATAGNAAAQATCLTNALAAAQYGDLIQTEPGATLDGNWTLSTPGGSLLTASASGVSAVSGSSGVHAVAGGSGVSATTATGTVNNYVTIRPASFDSHVAIGNRAGSAHTAYMTALRSSTSNYPVIISDQSAGASYWWLSGLELTHKPSETSSADIVTFSSLSDGSTALVDHMMIDRCYLHGDTSLNGATVLRGVRGAGSYIGIINSTIDDIKALYGQPDTQAYTQAIGPGPLHLENNLLGATTENIILETDTGETRSSLTVAANGTTVTANIFYHDAAGAAFNVPGSNTVTVASRDSATQITLSSPLTGVTLPYTGVGYVVYNHAADFFINDITIKRNHFKKKASWNIADPTFDRTTGGDTGMTNMTILAGDNTKIQAGTYSGISQDTRIFITSSSPWISGYAYCTSIDGSGNAVMNRVLGTVGSTGGTARKEYAVKNLFELKSGARTLVEGNVFENSWAGGQQYALVFTPRSRNVPVGDLTFQYNVVKNAYAIAAFKASEISDGHGNQPPYLEQDRMTFKHNLFENILTTTGSLYWAPGAPSSTMIWSIYAAPASAINGVTSGATTMDDFVWEHNTVVNSTIDGWVFYLGSGEDPTGFTKGARFIVRNNVMVGGSGLALSVFSGAGTTAIGQVADGTRVVTKNLLIDTDYDGANLTSPDTGNAVVTAANRSTINFTNYAGGDYTISSGTYATWASDGTPVGADIGTLNTKISGVAP